MAVNKVTTGTAAPELGRMVGVQYFLCGAVTEFGDADKGGGISLGVVGGFSDMFSSAVSRESASGAVAMDVRVVDSPPVKSSKRSG